MHPLSVCLFAGQKDDLDGEIDLKSCVKVSEFDVEKNYGFQIQVRIFVICFLFLSLTLFHFFIFPSHLIPLLSHLCFSNLFSSFVFQTQEAAFTLSAMTAGIRRNWIEVLKKCIRPSSSPDLTQ